MHHKICTGCQESLPADTEHFHKSSRGCRFGLVAKCKACRKSAYQIHYQQNKERIRDRNNTYRQNNRERYLDGKRKYYESHKEEYAEYSKRRYEANRDVILAKQREYYRDNPEKIKDQRQRSRIRDNERKKNKRRSDPIHRLHCNMRTSMSSCLSGKNKSGHTIEYTGLSLEELKTYLESLFLDGMSWGNYGNPNGDQTNCWHLDHIIPLANFNFTICTTSEELDAVLYAAWHYTNLQPLWAKDNIRKGSR